MAIGGIFKQIQVWQVHLLHDCSNSPEKKSTGEITPLPQLHLLVQINVNLLVPVFSTKTFSCQDGCMEPGGCTWVPLRCVCVERKSFLGKNSGHGVVVKRTGVFFVPTSRMIKASGTKPSKSEKNHDLGSDMLPGTGPRTCSTRFPGFKQKLDKTKCQAPSPLRSLKKNKALNETAFPTVNLSHVKVPNLLLKPIRIHHKTAAAW